MCIRERGVIPIIRMMEKVSSTGLGEYNLYRFTQRLAGDKLLLELEKTTAGYERSYENFMLKINGMEAAAVRADGKEITFSQDNGRVLVKIPATTKLVEVIEK